MKLYLMYFSAFLLSAFAVDNSSDISPQAKAALACGNSNCENVPFSLTDEKHFGEFPWMAAIAKLGYYHYECTGTLIHPQVVLTAAHCINNSDTYHVRIGEWIRTNYDELHPHQMRSVQTTTIHPDFKPGALHNDLALLFLKKPVRFTKNVGVICLPESTDYEDEECVAYGWSNGLFFQRGGFKKHEVTIGNASICEEELRKTPLGDSFKLHESFMCAGYENYVIGSPLMCSIGNSTRFYQAGIASWNIRAGEANSLFINVGLYKDWINQQINNSIK